MARLRAIPNMGDKRSEGGGQVRPANTRFDEEHWKAMEPVLDKLSRVHRKPITDDEAARPMTPDPNVQWPIDPVEVRDPHRGPGAWAGYLALRTAQLTLGRLPRSWRRALGRCLAPVAGWIDRRHTRAALDFVQCALPNKSAAEHRALVRTSWVHLFDLSLRAPYATRIMLHQPLGNYYEVTGTDRALQLAREHAPTILVSCHVGHWEAAGAALATLGYGPLYAVGKAPRNDPLSQMMQRMREIQGNRMLPRREAMKSVPHVINSGGTVAFFLDHRARIKPTFAPFFGRPAACERSASVLIRRTRAPIVLFKCLEAEGGKGYRLELGPVIEPEDISGLDSSELIAVLNHQFEGMILENPEQYFWLHDRFRETPRDWPALERMLAESAASSAIESPEP